MSERSVTAIRRSGLDRSEVFVETKVWIADYGYDQTLHAFDKSAGKLGVDQALETLLADGKVRAVGVSNFMPDHLARLMEATSVIPAVNQIEVHPYFRQSDPLAFDAEHDILSQAWSPIGGITFYRDGSKGSTLEDPVIRKIAENFDIFDFRLVDDELAAIDALDTGVRGSPEPDQITRKNFGIQIPEP